MKFRFKNCPSSLFQFQFLNIIFGPDLGHALSLKEPSSLSLFSHLLHFWNRLRSSDLPVLFKVPEQHADLSDDVEMRLTETMTKSTVGRLNKEKCTTVVHFFENCILQSKDGTQHTHCLNLSNKKSHNLNGKHFLQPATSIRMKCGCFISSPALSTRVKPFGCISPRTASRRPGGRSSCNRSTQAMGSPPS